MKDYYQILEISPDADSDAVRAAYRDQVRRFHPDQYHLRDKTRMTERMQAVNEAYEVLGDETRRRQYDRRYRAQSEKTAGRAMLRHRVMNVLLWGLFTYLALRFLLRPLLASPGLRLLLVSLLVLVLFYMVLRRRPAHNK